MCLPLPDHQTSQKAPMTINLCGRGAAPLCSLITQHFGAVGGLRVKCVSTCVKDTEGNPGVSIWPLSNPGAREVIKAKPSCWRQIPPAQGKWWRKLKDAEDWRQLLNIVDNTIHKHLSVSGLKSANNGQVNRKQKWMVSWLKCCLYCALNMGNIVRYSIILAWEYQCVNPCAVRWSTTVTSKVWMC